MASVSGRCRKSGPEEFGMRAGPDEDHEPSAAIFVQPAQEKEIAADAALAMAVQIAP